MSNKDIKEASPSPLTLTLEKVVFKLGEIWDELDKEYKKATSIEDIAQVWEKWCFAIDKIVMDIKHPLHVLEVKEDKEANIDTFQECSECSRKQINPESLLLCPGCLSNRSVISFLNRTIELQESTIKRLKENNTSDILIEALLNLLIVKLPYKGYSVYLGRFGLKEKNGITGKEWRPAGYYYDEDSYDKCREEIREYVLKLYKEDMSNL